MLDITPVIGGHFIFDYPRVLVSLFDYRVHSGQEVLVVRECTEDEADGPQQGCEQMYVIRAADGWEGAAWISELSNPGVVTSELCGH